MQSVKQQYERFPYPSVNALALPRRDQGEGLRYERAVELARANKLVEIRSASHAGIRILVAGCGTLEALVVAQMHPHAREVVALDFSRRALVSLQRRVHWARTRDLLSLARLRGVRLASIYTVEADVCDWYDDKGFDYVLANNMLHHTEQPAATLQHLAGLLKPGGVMRVVTYPAMSRFWLRQTSAWLRWHGLNADTPRLKQRAIEAIEELPRPHPLRSCFEAHSETVKTAGLVDAFFHACEQPLSPLQWQQATEAAGLEWLGESQSRYARAEFLTELMPATNTLSGWQQLQVLDDVLELTSNPIWWFCKRGEIVALPGRNDAMKQSPSGVEIPPCPPLEKRGWRDFFAGEGNDIYLSSEIYWQLGQSLRRADAILQQTGCSVDALIATLRQEVGPRLTRGGRELMGLTLGEYPVDELLASPQPLANQDWQQLQTELGSAAQLTYNNQAVPGTGLIQQVQWLQLCYGPLRAQIGPLMLRQR